MLAILAITGPIYFAITLGYLATRMGWFAKADMRVFGKFVVNLALPALLFNALARCNVGEILNASYVLAYLTGTLAVIGAPSDTHRFCKARASPNGRAIGLPVAALAGSAGIEPVVAHGRRAFGGHAYDGNLSNPGAGLWARSA